MKAKAKRLDNGEWVEGYYSNWKHFDGKKHIDVHTIDLGGFSSREHQIDPSTLCQQVRGTELFEGDEVQQKWMVANIFYCEETFSFRLKIWKEKEGDYFTFPFSKKWKPTGRNIHDLKSEEK